MAKIDDPRTLIGAKPIAGDAPAGANIRYEPEFTALQEQVARTETEGPLVVNWKQVAETGCHLLQTRSKDLLIAAYVTLALSRTEGYRGLGIGLAIVAGMVEAHWPGLEPPVKRERARVQMLEWIVARVTPLFAETPPSEAEWNDVIAAHESLAGIETELESKLTKETAALGELTRLLREHARNAERALAERAAAAVQAAADAAAATERAAAAAAAPPPPSEAPSATAATPAAAAVSAPAAVAAPTGADEVDVALSRLQSSMQAVGLGVLAVDNSDPRAYALIRAATWCSVQQLPMQTNGVTPLPPLPSDRIGQIAMMQQAGNHAGAITLIEQTIPSSPFWLDGHRLVCNSLQALGGRYDPARAAVMGSLAALLRRLDGLTDLAFSNRTPFAEEETRRWIVAEIMPSGGGGATEDDDGPVSALREARRLGATGKLREGLAALAAGAAGAVSLRVRAEWQIALAELCLGFNMLAIALPLLDHLDSVVVTFRLEEWDPAFAVRVSRISHDCLLHSEARTLRKEEDVLRGLEMHRGRMSRLDVVAAADALKL